MGTPGRRILLNSPIEILPICLALLFMVTVPVRGAAQPQYLSDSDCKAKESLLPKNAGMVVRFTVDRNVPRSEPPIHECKFGVEVLDQTGKPIASWGPVILSSPPVQEVLNIHEHLIVLIGTGELTALTFDAGALRVAGTWRGERVDYFRLPNDDLQIVIYNGYDRYDEMPIVLRFNGVESVPDDPGKRLVLERIVRESAAYVKDPNRGPNPFEISLKAASSCVRVLRAEAILGNAAFAIGLCASARKQIETWSTCLPDRPGCDVGFRESMLDRLDTAMSEARNTEAFRRFSPQTVP